MKQLFLSLILILLPMVASAYDAQINGICYNFDATNRTAAVTALSSGQYTGIMTIPSAVTYNNVTYSVTTIEDKAFYQSTITEITIPSSIVQIGQTSGYSDVFNYCNYLKKVHITSLEAWCRITFADCFYANPLSYAGHLYINGQELTELVIPSSIQSLGVFQFANCDGLTSIKIPSTVKHIGVAAFYACSNVKTISIDPGLTTISKNTFNSCTSATSITIPHTVTTIEDCAFSECYSLQCIDIPSSVTTIGMQAFYGCKAATSITIPSSVTTIGKIAFSGCASLQSVTVGRKAPATINADTFFDSYNSTVTLYVPAGKKGTYQSKDGWKYFSLMSEVTTVDITIGSSGIATFSSIFDLDFTKDKIWEKVVPYTVKTYDSEKGRIILDDIPYLYIPAGQGFVAKGEPGTHQLPVCNSTSRPASETLLTGVTAMTPVNKYSDGNTNFVLEEKDGSARFYPVAEGGTTLNAGSAFLPLPSASLKASALTNGLSVFLASEIEKTEFKLTYIVDGTVYKSYDMIVGTAITAEAAPTKEGYTFSGWSNIPETMPDNDVTVTGTFTINKYKLTYNVDGQDYKTFEVEYGAAITPESIPTKEGFKFSGWSEIPSTMPANDIIITGTFTAIPKCASPSISVVNGKLKFVCETEGAQCHYTITGIESQSGDGSEASLGTSYQVTVYASKDGYLNSETVTKEIKMSVGKKGDVNGDDDVDIADAVQIVNFVVGKIPALSREKHVEPQ